ncbi:protoporphyrinogen oxidase [Ornithinimicrobium sp. LYQ103]|uniref:protoporphyrinogen oxidase n=1 Tax=Ornithinimicrobium sp. LYQ103 TaxID=3378796 RepID=UPI00385494DF
MTSYLVIGGGISGLTAADEILRRDAAADVTVLEGADRVGGKIRAGRVAGCVVDVGAEAVLARRPEALDLIGLTGLSDEVVHPTGAPAQIWSRDRMHRIPARTLMGVPADPDALRGLLTEEEVERARHERVSTVVADDVSVSELVGGRLGLAVVERLVEPLLGGVYAGHAAHLSSAATLPALLAAARAGEPLLATVDRAVPVGGGTRAAGPSSRPPVFATVAGGLHRLPEALASSVRERGGRVVLGTVARELRQVPDGRWEAVTGPRPRPTSYLADRVVLAVPAAPAARLLTDVAPTAAGLLARIESASMAVVTLAFRTDELGPLHGSGFLVPPVDGHTVKASTFSAVKWDWVRELGRGAGPGGCDLTLLRVSVGRHREESVLQVSDDELVAVCRAELAQALGRALPEPVDAHVQRWGGGLPQYAVGHLDLVARVRAELDGVPHLVACGAAFDGVGIPACIASARRAVEELG